MALAQDLALMAVCAARAGHLGAWARGLVHGVRGARRALGTRQTLSVETYARLGALCALRPRLAARVRRHLRERLI